MKKGLVSLVCVVFTFAVIGCGGSGSTPTVGGNPATLYKATLPDGSPMLLEIMENSGGILIGGFSVSATEGVHADESGDFAGRIDGSSIQANCATVEGDQFSLSGTATADGFRLTRSDIPNTVLVFRPVTPPKSSTRSSISFKFTAGGKTGQVNLNASPSYSDSTMVEYSGFCNVTPIYVTFYKDGKACIIWDLGRAAGSAIAKFADYKVTDVTTKTVSSTSAHGLVLGYNAGYYFDAVMKCSP